MFNFLWVHDTFSMCVVAKFSKFNYNIHHNSFGRAACWLISHSWWKKIFITNIPANLVYQCFFFPRRWKISVVPYTYCELRGSKWCTQASSTVITVLRKIRSFISICFQSQDCLILVSIYSFIRWRDTNLKLTWRSCSLLHRTENISIFRMYIWCRYLITCQSSMCCNHAHTVLTFRQRKNHFLFGQALGASLLLKSSL